MTYLALPKAHFNGFKEIPMSWLKNLKMMLLELTCGGYASIPVHRYAMFKYI